MRYTVVIPARYQSQRLPGKPLLEIAGKPMIRHVWERAGQAGADGVVIATDDSRIFDACETFGAHVVMTSAQHSSGTDRIAEVSRMLDWDDDELIVNVQGDEPLIPPPVIAQVAGLLQGRPDAHMATLCTPIHDLDEYMDPNVVKLVAREDGAALYFSRAPIPWLRETAPAGLASQTRCRDALRHIGLYAYRAGALRALADTPACPLETIERLEQLRALWMGYTILTDIADEIPGPGVDTEIQLEEVRRLLGP
jgi:3-deoxy-manno-octulosonate cytidylyltransferase (CMP-KDO synthetase)